MEENQAQKEMLQRENWESIELPISLVPFRNQIIFYFASFAFLSITILSISILYNDLLRIPFDLILLLILAFGAITTAIASYTYGYGKSIKHTLYSGAIRMISDAEGKTRALEEKPGRVESKYGLFKRTRKILTADEFDRVEVYQSFYQRLGNYGTISLEQVDKLSQTQDYLIRYVHDPKKFAAIIETIVEKSNNKAMPV